MIHTEYIHQLSQPALLFDCVQGDFTLYNAAAEQFFAASDKPALLALCGELAQQMTLFEVANAKRTLQVQGDDYEFYFKGRWLDRDHRLLCLTIDYVDDLSPFDASMLAELIPDGIMVVEISSEGYFAKYVNNSLSNLLGYTRAECAEYFSHDVLQFIHSEDVPCGLDALKKQLAEDNTFYLNGRLQKKDGTSVWVNFLGKRVICPNGKEYFFTVITDVTDTLRMTEQLHQEK